MTTSRRDIIIPPLVAGVIFGAVVLIAYYGSAAADPIDTVPDVSSAGIERWWENGRLACVAAFVLFVVLKLAARSIPWLRRGRYQAWVALGVASVTCVLPAAAMGTLTWGNLMLALCTGGGMAMQAGGGEVKGEASGEIEAGDGAPT